MENQYRLYKLVFRNKYVSNIIFNYVYEINIKFKFPTLRYDKISLEWISKTNNYSLLEDKIKSNYCFKKTELTYNGLMFLFEYLYKLDDNNSNNNNSNSNDNNSNNNDQDYRNNLDNKKNYKNHLKLINKKGIKILKQFFNNNSNNLFQCDLNHSTFTHYRNISLVKFAIHTKCFEFFKMVNEDPKKFSIGSNCLFHETDRNSMTYLNDDDLLDVALKYGNLEIIKYVHKHMGFQIKDHQKALHHSLMSINRSFVVEYLLDELKYEPPKKHTGSFDNYFSNLLLLDFKLFKRLYQMGSPLLYSDRSFSYLLDNKLNDTFSTTEKINFKKEYLQFIKSSIYVASLGFVSTEFNSNHFNLLLSKIEKLENNILTTTTTTSTTITSTTTTTTSNDNNNNNNNNNNNSNNDNDHDNDNNNIEQISALSILKNKLKFKKEKKVSQEREIRRIFIFDFLLTIKSLSGSTMTRMITDFTREYGEYGSLPSNLAKLSILRVTLNTTCSILLGIANYHCDYNLVEIVNKHYNKTKEISKVLSLRDNHTPQTTSNLFNTKIVRIEDQLCYVELLVENNINHPVHSIVVLHHILIHNDFQILLPYINKILKIVNIIYDNFKKSEKDSINNNNSNNSNNSNRYSYNIESYYKNLYRDDSEFIKDNYLSASIFVQNKDLFIYFFKKHRDFFIWGLDDINKRARLANDLELLDFIKDSDIYY
ncbi:hypothetical protein ACTFIU_003173 [Dictyostelium citrinum]